MICPRPGCSSTLFQDEPDEWHCLACSRRWTTAQLKAAVKGGPGGEGDPTERTRAGTTTEPGEDTDADEASDELGGGSVRKWTNEHRAAFQETMRKKRAARDAGERGEPAHKGPGPQSPSAGRVSRAAALGDVPHDESDGGGVAWAEWKRDWLERVKVEAL